MKNRNIILLAFLLFLYIAPSFLSMSYSDSSILAEQNMSKEFVISDGELWYDENFHYRKLVTIDYGGDASDAGSDYQIEIPITYNAHMQTDFDDIRFTEDDGNTTLDYWRESYVASTSAVFWVEISDYQEVGVTVSIYMYYGNSTVSTTSNGTNTFIFFDDFENNNLNRWSNRGAYWSTQTAQKKYGTYAAYADSGTTSASRYLYDAQETKYETGIMIHSWVRVQSVTGDCYPIFAWEEDDTVIYAGIITSNDWATYDGTLHYYEENTVVVNTWFEYEVAFDFTNSLFVPFIDGVHKTDQDLDALGGADVTDTNQWGAVCNGDATNRDMWIDDYYVRKWILNEPDVIGFGAEEDNLPDPEWQEVGEAELVFIVPIDETALNWFLIILGMFMVPASTLYLVKGGKNNASMDKVFYFIVAFLFGWGLIFIGVS